MAFLIRITCLVLLTLSLPAAGFDHSSWDHLLKAHVRLLRGGVATQVDYEGMWRDRNRLKGYLDALAAVPRNTYESWSRSEQLAFLINAYNAWTVELILSRQPRVRSIKELGTLFKSPWKFLFIPLLGEKRSLDDLEHGLIRSFSEPRIHFAVNCASVGCPALQPEAYGADRLELQLEAATRGFLADRTRNRLAKGRLELSSVFQWYRKDFGDLGEFLARYGQALGLDAETAARLGRGQVEITFLAYDWSLNGPT